MKNFIVSVIMILVLGGFAIAAKSDPNSPGTQGRNLTKLLSSQVYNLKQLNRKDLKPEEKAYIRLKIAKTFEALPACGRLAKERYGEILELHPEYHQNVKIAYRLAELNDGITLDGTTPNTQQAIDCYRYVIERRADRSRSDQGMQYETLMAYRCLGHLYLNQLQYEEARKQFETIYNCEPGMLYIVPDEELKHPEDIASQKAWVLERLESMKADMPKEIVSTCIRSDPEESLKALQELMKVYASDSNIATIAQSVYEQETARKDAADKLQKMLNASEGK